LKTQLAAELKQFKETGNSFSDADVRKEILGKYIGGIEELEGAIEKLARAKVSVAESDIQLQKSPSVNRRVVEPEEKHGSEDAKSLLVGRSSKQGTDESKSPVVARPVKQSSDESKSPGLARPVKQSSDEIKGTDRSLKQSRDDNNAMQRSSPIARQVVDPVPMEEEPADHSIIELEKFAQSYNPEAKFERAQPGVPQSVSKVRYCVGFFFVVFF
jgi:hypothetical protein